LIDRLRRKIRFELDVHKWISKQDGRLDTTAAKGEGVTPDRNDNGYATSNRGQAPGAVIPRRDAQCHTSERLVGLRPMDIAEGDVLGGKMPSRKGPRRQRSPFPDRQLIAKAEGRFAKADKQRASIKADPKKAVKLEQERLGRVRSAKKSINRASR
jgi:hypothetical protein